MSQIGRHLTRLGIETLIIVILGAAGGLILNSVREERLTFELTEAQLLLESGAQIVTPVGARKLFDQGEYIFVDARDTKEYLEGHIEGSFSLPTSQFDELYSELTLWSGGQPLLVYGDAVQVPIVDDLARRLRKVGEEKIAIMPAGFQAWKARGYPVATGGEGLLAPIESE